MSDSLTLTAEQTAAIDSSTIMPPVDVARGRYARVYGADAMRLALSVTRGCYQRAIVDGTEAMSGATLRGKASRYAGRYSMSVRSLIRRLDSVPGLHVEERREDHGRRVLVIALASN